LRLSDRLFSLIPDLPHVVTHPRQLLGYYSIIWFNPRQTILLGLYHFNTLFNKANSFHRSWSRTAFPLKLIKIYLFENILIQTRHGYCHSFIICIASYTSCSFWLWTTSNKLAIRASFNRWNICMAMRMP